jgi:hypothetical protein
MPTTLASTDRVGQLLTLEPVVNSTANDPGRVDVSF